MSRIIFLKSDNIIHDFSKLNVILRENTTRWFRVIISKSTVLFLICDGYGYSNCQLPVTVPYKFGKFRVVNKCPVLNVTRHLKYSYTFSVGDTISTTCKIVSVIFSSPCMFTETGGNFFTLVRGIRIFRSARFSVYTLPMYLCNDLVDCTNRYFECSDFLCFPTFWDS